ncbi:alanyl-tRNA synthetase [Eggerthella sp. YY7918]|nr:alanyl-tRNA synthetase [Eggerthella sp. YY7918]
MKLRRVETTGGSERPRETKEHDMNEETIRGHLNKGGFALAPYSCSAKQAMALTSSATDLQ